VAPTQHAHTHTETHRHRNGSRTQGEGAGAEALWYAFPMVILRARMHSHTTSAGVISDDAIDCD
jgi:hypothetical protein